MGPRVPLREKKLKNVGTECALLPSYLVVSEFMAQWISPVGEGRLGR